MKELEQKLPVFNVSIGSVFAGLLLFGALQAMIKIVHEPLAYGVIRLLHHFVKSSTLDLRQPPTDWTFVLASVATILILLAASVILGARTMKALPKSP